MNAKTAPQALDKIREILEQEEFNPTHKGNYMLDISFEQLPLLYRALRFAFGSRVNVHLPGERCTEGMLIIFQVTPEFRIYVESEPCVSLGWKMKFGATKDWKHDLIHPQ